MILTFLSFLLFSNSLTVRRYTSIFTMGIRSKHNKSNKDGSSALPDSKFLIPEKSFKALPSLPKNKWSAAARLRYGRYKPLPLLPKRKRSTAPLPSNFCSDELLSRAKRIYGCNAKLEIKNFISIDVINKQDLYNQLRKSILNQN